MEVPMENIEKRLISKKETEFHLADQWTCNNCDTIQECKDVYEEYHTGYKLHIIISRCSNCKMENHFTFDNATEMMALGKTW